MLTNLDIAHRRLDHQHISEPALYKPYDVVNELGAVQAQDYLGVLWALGLRIQNSTDALIERAFAEGTILRTHVLRPTWHFVTPADIRWMLELTAPRVKAKMAHMDRQLELDNALFSRANAVLVKALQGGQQLTRVELGVALAQAGFAIEGLRLQQIVMHAELDAVLCSGPRRGKQFTYMLLDERPPQARRLNRDEALAELTRRYYTGHGPATVRDFVWWSGLTTADAKAGLDMVADHLVHEVIDGQTYWFSEANPPVAESRQAAFLLPTFDEFLVGFDSFGKSLRGGRAVSENGTFNSPIVLGGKVVGSWRRTLNKGSVVIAFAPFSPLTAAEIEVIKSAAQRYGEFLNMPVMLVPG